MTQKRTVKHKEYQNTPRTTTEMMIKTKTNSYKRYENGINAWKKRKTAKRNNPSKSPNNLEENTRGT